MNLSKKEEEQLKKFLKENPADRWGDKNLDEIKNHKFFKYNFYKFKKNWNVEKFRKNSQQKQSKS